MIADDFVHFTANGLYCPYGNFYIDPQQPVSCAVISHAHGDHAISGNAEVYATPSTLQFMQIRYGKNAGRALHPINYHTQFKIGKVSITLLPAGHMLGSAQLLMEYNGISYIYTGDYKLQHDNSCEPYEFVRADVLITESTFAHPDTAHPDQAAEMHKLNHIKMNILLGAYGLGKSQRLIRLINDFNPQKQVLVHHRIMPLCQVYEQAGFRLGQYQLYNRKLMKEQKEYIYLVPPFTFDSYFKATGVKRLFASGWRHLQVSAQDTLFISDHADWSEILQVVEYTRPQQLWTLHGDGRQLAAHFDGRIFVKILA